MTEISPQEGQVEVQAEVGMAALRCFGGPLHGRTVASPADRLYAAMPRRPRQWINDFGRTSSPRQVAKVTYRRERVRVRDQTFECWVAEDYPSNLVLREVDAIDGAPPATDAGSDPRSPQEPST